MSESTGFLARAPVIRAVIGTVVALGLLCSAVVVGFLGIWTFVGFKTPGQPGPGGLLLMAAVAMCAGVGAMLAWAFSWHRAIARTSIVFGFAGSALIVWVLSAN